MRVPLANRSMMRRFLRDGRGNIATMFALMLVPLVLTAGVGADYARGLNFKNNLQAAVDAAALAGASAYNATSGSTLPVTIATNYMNNAIAQLPANKGVTFTVTTSTSASGSNTTGYNVNVAATAQVSNAFMGLASINTTSISVTALAQNPVTQMLINTSGFSSSACDTNTIYWFTIPSTATAKTYVPPTSALHQVWSNASPNSAPTPITLTSSSEQIGFAMKNVTCNGYGNNSYGGKPGSTHYFYSNLFPPSSQAYPSESQNRSLQVVALPTGGTLASTLSSLPEQGFNYDFTNASPTCGSLNNKTYVYAWNDMGGPSDDLDYNDAAYTFSCSGVSGSSGASGVVLLK